MSAQLQPLSTMLCAEARRILENMDNAWSTIGTSTGIEHIQAWLLVAHWELLCNHENQAMVTAGRAIRMAQLARLHDIDSRSGVFTPRAECSMAEQSFVDAEERRRTFWLAYCFDRFCLMHNDCPTSLQEQSVSHQTQSPPRFCIFRWGKEASSRSTSLIIGTATYSSPCTRSQLSKRPTCADGVPVRCARATKSE